MKATVGYISAGFRYRNITFICCYPARYFLPFWQKISRHACKKTSLTAICNEFLLVTLKGLNSYTEIVGCWGVILRFFLNALKFTHILIALEAASCANNKNKFLLALSHKVLWVNHVQISKINSSLLFS